jgi:hypothetical protein
MIEGAFKTNTVSPVLTRFVGESNMQTLSPETKEAHGVALRKSVVCGTIQVPARRPSVPFLLGWRVCRASHKPTVRPHVLLVAVPGLLFMHGAASRTRGRSHTGSVEKW